MKNEEVLVVLDGARKFTVARSVTFYEQALVNAMRTNVGMHLSDIDVSGFQLVQPRFSENSEGTSDLSPMENHAESKSSLTDSIASSELKTSAVPGRTLESAQPLRGGSTPDSGGNSL